MASARGSVSSGWEWTLAGVLSVNLVFTLLLNGGYGPRYEGVTALLTAVLFGVHAASILLGRAALRLHPASWLPLPFAAYAAIHTVWLTPVPWLAQRDLTLWVQMAVIFWVVLNGITSRAPRRLVLHTLVAVALIGVGVGCYQVFVEPGWRLAGVARPGEQAGRATGSFGLANSFAGLLLLLIPAAGARVLRPATATVRVWWTWVGLVLLAGLVFTLSRGAWLALAITLIAAPLLALRLAWSRRAWVVVSIVVILGAAGWLVGRWVPGASERVAQFLTDGGERTRPFMWAGAWRLWLDAPVAGNGAGSYNLLFERHRAEGFRDEPLWAHNEYLNLLADYGLLGAILAAGAAGVALAGSWRARAPGPPAGWGWGCWLSRCSWRLSFTSKSRDWSSRRRPWPRWPWRGCGPLRRPVPPARGRAGRSSRRRVSRSAAGSFPSDREAPPRRCGCRRGRRWTDWRRCPPVTALTRGRCRGRARRWRRRRGSTRPTRRCGLIFPTPVR